MRLLCFPRLLLAGFGILFAAPSLPAQLLTGPYDAYAIFPGENPTAISFSSPLLTMWGGSTLTVGTGSYNFSQIDDIEMWSGVSLTLSAHAWLQMNSASIKGDNVRITLAATSSATRTTLDGYGQFAFLGSDAVVTVNSRTTFNADTLYLGYGGFNPADALNNQVIVTGANAQLRVANDFVVGRAGTDSSGNLRRGGGTLTVQSGGNVEATSGLTLARNATSSGTLNIGAYDLTNPTTAGTVTSPSVTLAGGEGTINFNQTNATTFTAAISGIGQIVQRGTGTTTLSGSNGGFVGTTTVSGGTLALASSGALGTGTVYVQNGRTLDLGGTTQTVAALGELGHGLVGDITAGTINTTGYVVLQSGTFATTFTGSGDDARLWIGGDANATVTLNGTNDRVFTFEDDHNQVIIGSDFHGPAGVVRIGNANALAAATENVHLFSGTLDLNGIANVRANSIWMHDGADTALMNQNTASTASFAGDVSTDSPSSWFGGDGDLILSGQVSGFGSLNKSGAGTLTLTGADSFSNTTIIGGTLAIGNGGTVGSISGNIVNDSALVFNRSDASTFSETISGTGSVTVTGGGTLTLSGDNTYTGDTFIQTGTVRINNSTGSAFGTGAVTVASGATLGGSGSIDGLTTFANGAHLAPGNSPGTLTFTDGLSLSSGTILDFELGTSSDLIRVSGGTLTGPSSGTVTINLSNSGGFAANTYELFNFSGATLSDFSEVDFLLGADIDGYDYVLNLTATSLQLIATVSAVPEPSTYALLAGAVTLGFAILRRRRMAVAA